MDSTSHPAPVGRRPGRLAPAGRWWIAVVVWAGCAGAAEPEKRKFDLPSGDAAVTLRQLSETARKEILFSAEIVRGVKTNAVRGEFTALEAGNRMLAGTRLYALQDERSGALAVRQESSPPAGARAAAPAARSRPVPAAILRGRVFNAITHQSLEGATVQVAGAAPVATERDGTYAVERLAAGVVTVKVAYPGLEDVTATVELAAAGPVLRDFPLTSSIYAMERYDVMALREGNAAALARQERALTITNAVAIDAYGNIAKGDLGSFLQRLPGVVGEYGGSAVDAIVVRGLSPEFTSVMMDGTRAAVANPDSRTQIVSSMPSGAIESVEVIKTPTADMDADSLGGVVNLRTRSGFDRTGRSIVLNLAGNYNETMGRHLDPSGGGRTIVPQVSAGYSDVREHFGRKLGVSLTGSYQEVGDGLQTIRADFATNWDYQGPTLPRRVVYADQEFHLNKRADLHSKFDYKLSADSSLSLAAGFTRFRNVMEQVRPKYVDNLVIDPARTTEDYWVFSRVRYRSTREFRDSPTATWRFQLSGKHAPGAVKLAWDLSFSDSVRPLERIAASARSNHDFELIYDRRGSRVFPTLSFGGGIPPPEDLFDDLLLINLTGTRDRAADRILAAKLDLTRDFAGWRRPVKFKTGVRVRRQDRTRDFDEISGALGAGDHRVYRDFNFTRGWVDGRYPATPIVDTQALFRDAAIRYQPSGLAARPSVQFTYDPSFLPANLGASATNSLLNDYRTREVIPATYLQAESRLSSRLQATGGLRFEQTRTRITSRLDDAHFTVAEERYGAFKTVESDYADWFPNLQFRYAPIGRLTLRANLSTTIGRPRMADLVGRFSVNEIGQVVSFANPSLLPQKSRNFDLSAEYYFQPAGVLSVGLFRKEINNYVSATSFRIIGNEYGYDLTPYAGWTGSTRVNTGDGRVEGIEFNYVQQLAFLPGRWRGLGMMANWTVLTSAGDYNGLVPALPFNNYLVGLRPRSGNAGLTYDHGRWDLRLMWNFASSYLNALDVSDPSSSEFIGGREQWDFFVRFRLSRPVSVFLDVINLAQDNRARFRGLYRADRQTQTNVFPRSISAGVQARF